MKNIHLRLLVILLGLTLGGCNKYTNKEKYVISIGKKLDLYYSTNSCCCYCLSNEKELKHINLLGRKMIDKRPKNCEGCNYIAAFTLQGKSIGVDTIELKLLTATMSCDESEGQIERYIIEVK
ncbi:MAG: hypothetical protein J7604_21570 [Sporocytophaga sp.]|uniref:hypothetical protein n=1 Tax=Sporocytophaga sp. TaxID=2231183 RepID=UPI001B19F6CA|nr:hypothetical protein [Sporocytophaga sp.]MBO9702817.1 hypothetical protein [Sporocytophaga sp.]